MKTVHSTVFLFINNLLKNKTPVESINNTTKAKSYFQKKRVLFQAMIFETAFQNLVVLIYVVKTDLFCFMRSAFLLYITLISCHNYLNI